MKPLLTKLIFVLVSLCFVLAVFEVDVGESRHGFNDDDDTYVQGINQSHYLCKVVEKHTTHTVDFLPLFSWLPAENSRPLPSRKTTNLTSAPAFACKIYLRNSVWRI